MFTMEFPQLSYGKKDYNLKKKKLRCFNPNLGQNMDKPSLWVHFLNYVFDQTFEFVHI